MTEPTLEAAPLVATPAAPRPGQGRAVYLKARDDVRLRAALFHPKLAPIGSVVLSGGKSEPIEKYYEVIGELLERRFVVLAHDWRGQGLSGRLLPDRLIAHARGWRPFLADLDLLLEAFEAELPKPWIALGHSMGGGLMALALAEGETRFAACVLCAPMLGLQTGGRTRALVETLSFGMNFIGRAKALVAPNQDPLHETFEANILTHDRARWERTFGLIEAEPDLRLGGVTWGWLAFAMTLAARVKASRRIDRLATPLLVLLAEEEKIVDNRPAAALAERAPKGRSVTIKGAYHEILMEADERRAEALAAFDGLLAELRAIGVLAAAKPSRARPAGGPKGAGAGKPGPTLKEKKASAAAKTRP